MEQDLLLLPDLEPVLDRVSLPVMVPVQVGRNPGARGNIMSTMLLGQAVAETSALYGLVVAMILLFVV